MIATMSETSDDPYELHARRFLDRLERISRDFHDSNEAVDGLTQQLGKWWPQILAAFWWAATANSESAAAQDISEALMACAEGDIAQLQFRRTSADVQCWAEAAANYARQICDNPNDAAFLYRFAGIAEVQRGILKIAEDTRMQVHDVLRHVPDIIPELRDEQATQKEE